MLRITLAINRDVIADYEVKRVTSAATRPKPADVNRYEVRSIPDMTLLGSINHQYGAGAGALARQALAFCYRLRAGEVT